MNNYCLYCDSVIQAEMTWAKLLFGLRDEKLCLECRRKLTLIQGEVCRICSRPLAELAAKYIHQDLCHDCFRWEEDPRWTGVLERNLSLYPYNDFMKELLARFKYRGDYVLAKAFATDICDRLSELSFGTIVPIPLSEERLLERGFNQAKALAVEAGFETIDALARIHGEKQSKKSREERIHLQQVFKVMDEETVAGKKILLVDDIYTTGSTLRHAAQALRKSGAERVISFTLARG